MAIKIQGDIVIDDSRNIVNVVDATVTGTVTAGSFVGDGSGIVNINTSYPVGTVRLVDSVYLNNLPSNELHVDDFIEIDLTQYPALAALSQPFPSVAVTQVERYRSLEYKEVMNTKNYSLRFRYDNVTIDVFEYNPVTFKFEFRNSSTVSNFSSLTLIQDFYFSDCVVIKDFNTSEFLFYIVTSVGIVEQRITYSDSSGSSNYSTSKLYSIGTDGGTGNSTLQVYTRSGDTVVKNTVGNFGRPSVSMGTSPSYKGFCSDDRVVVINSSSNGIEFWTISPTLQLESSINDSRLSSAGDLRFFDLDLYAVFAKSNDSINSYILLKRISSTWSIVQTTNEYTSFFPYLDYSKDYITVVSIPSLILENNKSVLISVNTTTDTINFIESPLQLIPNTGDSASIIINNLNITEYSIFEIYRSSNNATVDISSMIVNVDNQVLLINEIREAFSNKKTVITVS